MLYIVEEVASNRGVVRVDATPTDNRECTYVSGATQSDTDMVLEVGEYTKCSVLGEYTR